MKARLKIRRAIVQLYGRTLIANSEGVVEFYNEQLLSETLLEFLRKHYPDEPSKLQNNLESNVTNSRLRTTHCAGHYISCNFAGLWSQCGLVVFENWRQAGNVANDMVDFHFKRLETIAVKCLGYSTAMVTLVDPDKIAMAERQGYQKIDNFVNIRSSNRVYLLTKKLQ